MAWGITACGPPAPPPATPGKVVGEPCQAQADCQGGLRCEDSVCVYARCSVALDPAAYCAQRLGVERRRASCDGDGQCVARGGSFEDPCDEQTPCDFGLACAASRCVETCLSDASCFKDQEVCSPLSDAATSPRVCAPWTLASSCAKRLKPDEACQEALADELARCDERGQCVTGLAWVGLLVVDDSEGASCDFRGLGLAAPGADLLWASATLQGQTYAGRVVTHLPGAQRNDLSQARDLSLARLGVRDQAQATASCPQLPWRFDPEHQLSLGCQGGALLVFEDEQRAPAPSLEGATVTIAELDHACASEEPPGLDRFHVFACVSSKASCASLDCMRCEQALHPEPLSGIVQLSVLAPEPS